MNSSRRQKTGKFSSIIEICESRQLLSATSSPIDGLGNNLTTPYLGSTDIQLLRIADAEYGDGYASPRRYRSAERERDQ